MERTASGCVSLVFRMWRVAIEVVDIGSITHCCYLITCVFLLKFAPVSQPIISPENTENCLRETSRDLYITAQIDCHFT